MINKREGVGIDQFNHPKAFIEYSNNIRDVYKNIDEYHPDKENKKLTVPDDMIADMVHNKKLNSIVTELFIGSLPNHTLNTSHFFITKIPNKRELQQTAINYSSDINAKDFTNIYRESTAEPYFLFS